MRFYLERVTQPEIEPITLAETKRYLRMFDDVTAEDDDISVLITAAREWVEDYTGRALVDQTWRLTIDNNPLLAWSGDYVKGDFLTLPSYGFIGIGRYNWHQHISRGEILLRKAPVLAIESFVSFDVSDVETTIDPTTYELRLKDSKWPRIVSLNGATWPINYGLRIVFRAGFSDQTNSPQQSTSVIPKRFGQAMKLWIDANYNRDPATMWNLLNTAELLIKTECSNLQIA